MDMPQTDACEMDPIPPFSDPPLRPLAEAGAKIGDALAGEKIAQLDDMVQSSVRLIRSLVRMAYPDRLSEADLKRVGPPLLSSAEEVLAYADLAEGMRETIALHIRIAAGI